MHIINFLIFIIFSALILASALVAVFAKNIVYSILGAVVSFMSVAGIFFMLNADFVGVAQIVIYGVGVSILLAFAIMFTSKEQNKSLYLTNIPRTILAIVLVFLLFLVISCFISPKFLNNSVGNFVIQEPSVTQVRIIQNNGTTKIIGKRLFCDYVLPFELLSVLLLAGIAGAGYLAGKES